MCSKADERERKRETERERNYQYYIKKEKTQLRIDTELTLVNSSNIKKKNLCYVNYSRK